jgi:hypothetical protein
MPLLKLVPGAALSLLALAAHAESPESSETKRVPAQRYDSITAAEKDAAPDDIICLSESPVGSHVKRRTCLTREQREEQARKSQGLKQGMERKTAQDRHER